MLEVACGTGYWTQHIAVAKRVYACDINEPCSRSRARSRSAGKAFFKADAVSLEGVPAGCNAAFAGFWWSHVKKAGIAQFAEPRRALEPGAVVGILDNQFAEGSSTPSRARTRKATPTR